jgi:hypothetical protein
VNTGDSQSSGLRRKAVCVRNTIMLLAPRIHVAACTSSYSCVLYVAQSVVTIAHDVFQALVGPVRRVAACEGLAMFRVAPCGFGRSSPRFGESFEDCAIRWWCRRETTHLSSWEWVVRS